MTIPIATMNAAEIWKDQRLVLIFTQNLSGSGSNPSCPPLVTDTEGG